MAYPVYIPTYTIDLYTQLNAIINAKTFKLLITNGNQFRRKVPQYSQDLSEHFMNIT